MSDEQRRRIGFGPIAYPDAEASMTAAEVAALKRFTQADLDAAYQKGQSDALKGFSHVRYDVIRLVAPIFHDNVCGALDAASRYVAFNEGDGAAEPSAAPPGF